MERATDEVKIATCLWFDKNAEEAAKFYAATFPNSRVLAMHRAPRDPPGGKSREVLTVEFTVLGQRFVGLNGGSQFTFDEAISFQVFTDTQEETDRYWNAIVGGGGRGSVCGWCKDKFGLSWQIVPRALIEAINDPDAAAARRAMDAMMTMKKIDIARIEAARAAGASTLRPV
jgi:2-polyprenyl-6-hydroxyphenyl methylase/3-demethylubiquinone-9 3-methyltransferase